MRQKWLWLEQHLAPPTRRGSTPPRLTPDSTDLNRRRKTSARNSPMTLHCFSMRSTSRSRLFYSLDLQPHDCWFHEIWWFPLFDSSIRIPLVEILSDFSKWRNSPVWLSLIAFSIFYLWMLLEIWLSIWLKTRLWYCFSNQISWIVRRSILALIRSCYWFCNLICD